VSISFSNFLGETLLYTISPFFFPSLYVVASPSLSNTAVFFVGNLRVTPVCATPPIAPKAIDKNPSSEEKASDKCSLKDFSPSVSKPTLSATTLVSSSADSCTDSPTYL